MSYELYDNRGYLTWFASIGSVRAMRESAVGKELRLFFEQGATDRPAC